jgi:hypothetical protein
MLRKKYIQTGCPPYENQKSLVFQRGSFCFLMNMLWKRIINTTERITDFRSKQAEHSNYDDGDERQNDRILDETLAQFLGCKKHDNIPFK